MLTDLLRNLVSLSLSLSSSVQPSPVQSCRQPAQTASRLACARSHLLAALAQHLSLELGNTGTAAKWK